jgi:plasmid stabilization system protein ParE
VSFTPILRPDVERDLEEARDWYENRRVGLGAEFLKAVDDAIDRICESPLLYAAEYKSVRRAGLTRFPYVVYYRVLGSSIELIAVLHANREDRRWRSRL